MNKQDFQTAFAMMVILLNLVLANVVTIIAVHDMRKTHARLEYLTGEVRSWTAIRKSVLNMLIPDKKEREEFDRYIQEFDEEKTIWR